MPCDLPRSPDERHEIGSRSALRDRRDVGEIFVLQIGIEMKPQDILNAGDVGPRDVDDALEPSGPRERGVHARGIVGPGDHDDVAPGLGRQRAVQPDKGAVDYRNPKVTVVTIKSISLGQR